MATYVNINDLNPEGTNDVNGGVEAFSDVEKESSTTSFFAYNPSFRGGVSVAVG